MKLKREQLHPYQVKAVQHIKDNPGCGLFLEMGLGKTVSSLTAISDMLESGDIKKVLVIAPKRVTEVTWGDEIANWEHLSHLTISVVSGPEKKRLEAVSKPANIYACSRDNLVWLILNTKFDYDMVVIDELSSFKSPSAKRFKAMRKARTKVKRIVGLTGTPAPNSLIDLWAQLFLLDGGQRLGKTLTGFRDRWFRPGRRNGDIVYEYILKNPECEKQIGEAIKDICISMTAEDYLKMPDKIMINDVVKLSPKQLKEYKSFEKDQVMKLSEEVTLTAASAASLSNKLCQYANGAIYGEDKEVIHLHDGKIDRLKEIIEAANGQPVLVAYAYRHDLSRIKEALKEYKPEVLDGGDSMKRWNNGKIQVLITHPGSAGHGLNLQKGGNILVWFGNTWSLELYLQFNARLYRQGQTKPVYIHHIITEGTVDEKILAAISGKKKTQDCLMDYIKQLMLKYNDKGTDKTDTV